MRDVTATEAEGLAVTLDRLYRAESGRILATLIRLLGSFDLAEDALQEAFAAAARQWPQDGVPANPRAWLVSTGRFKAIDALRRKSRRDASLDELAERLEAMPEGAGGLAGYPASVAGNGGLPEDESVKDDQLRLIFMCCHPALPADARAALTLREVCGLTTEEIARAFLTAAPTVAQRIVRAKAKIRDAGIPFAAPDPDELPDRLDTVLQVIYLVFNEGYSASAGGSLTRPDVSGEAIRLGRLLLDLLPQPEVAGLLALMLLQDARRTARTSPAGELITLEEQDRSLWDRRQMAEGLALVEHAMAGRDYGRYTMQAAIAAEHARAASAEQTDWAAIARLYERLLPLQPSPVVELNRAVAVAMAQGPEAGLALVDQLIEGGELARYHLVYAARADLCRRLGRKAEAREAYQKALALAQQEVERRFLERRLAELKTRP
jgi:RNA polymerase sigma-70 factor (ECF subfamily)